MDAFRDNWSRYGEIGAAAAVIVEDTLVVDLWTGSADAADTRPWTRNTLVQVFGITQTLTALCVLMLADAGIIELDAPVARYWPAFGDGGKVPLTVRHMLQHPVGVPALLAGFDAAMLTDWDAMTMCIAADTAAWTASRAAGCAPFTAGYVLGEVVRRVSGRSVGTFFHDEVARPLTVDVHIGGLGTEQDHRIADVVGPDTIPDSNSRAWRHAEVPAMNGHATARGLARLMAVFAVGGERERVRLLSPRMLARAVTSHLLCPAAPAFVAAPHAISGHGFGGATVLADPDARLGFAYTPNRILPASDPPATDLRAAALLIALYDAL